mmetsp:Transcript_6339/g.11882  ORF Transcript_6339/g.11882 Transcript_6339/m.11882 type:complete len:248 (+) Transcript_6339:593-1336(+)
MIRVSPLRLAQMPHAATPGLGDGKTPEQSFGTRTVSLTLRGREKAERATRRSSCPVGRRAVLRSLDGSSTTPRTPRTSSTFGRRRRSRMLVTMKIYCPHAGAKKSFAKRSSRSAWQICWSKSSSISLAPETSRAMIKMGSALQRCKARIQAMQAGQGLTQMLPERPWPWNLSGAHPHSLGRSQQKGGCSRLLCGGEAERLGHLQWCPSSRKRPAILRLRLLLKIAGSSPPGTGQAPSRGRLTPFWTA